MKAAAGFRRRRHLLTAVTVKWGSVTAAPRLKRRDLVTAAAGSPVTAAAGLRRRDLVTAVAELRRRRGEATKNKFFAEVPAFVVVPFVSCVGGVLTPLCKTGENVLLQTKKIAQSEYAVAHSQITTTP